MVEREQQVGRQDDSAERRDEDRPAYEKPQLFVIGRANDLVRGNRFGSAPDYGASRYFIW